MTRSHSWADPAKESAPTGVPEGSAAQTKSKGKEGGVHGKRKFDDTEFDKPDARKDMFSVKKNEKRTKKIEAEQRTYINPFIPEPSLTVAEHEAHSHALSQAQHNALFSDSSTGGQSLFSKSLASTSNQDTVLAPSKVPASTSKARSQTPSWPPLTLAPLLHPQSKTAPAKGQKSPSVPRSFLVPSTKHASSPPILESTHFSTPSSSTQGPSVQQTHTLSPSTRWSALQKTSKVVTDKISALKTRVAHLEDELQDTRDSVADMKKNQQKTSAENDELMKLCGEFGELKEESEAQGKLLHAIERILEGLKANGGSLDKAMVKIETSTRNNAFNVSNALYL